MKNSIFTLKNLDLLLKVTNLLPQWDK